MSESLAPAWQTPYYRVDEQRLWNNLQRMDALRQRSGARLVLALKCFATWSVFPLMRPYMDGTTSSSLHELKLGHEKFGGESHAYCVAWAEHEIAEALAHADKLIVNSMAQLERFGARARAAGVPLGLRVNPGVSNSPYLLADPARPHSRLGEADPVRVAAVVGQLSGLMFHNNCENRSYERFDAMLSHIEAVYGASLERVQWVSLGGGIHFCEPGYPLDALADRLKVFANRYGVQVYLEPGEAAVTDAATLELSVLDVGFNGKPFVVVDSSIEAHMLDLLVYGLPARIEPNQGEHRYVVCGVSCLAGDIFGEFAFAQPLQVGDRISVRDAAGYTMVKKNWFNGLAMPSIVVARRDGREEVVQTFGYADYVRSLS